MIQTSYKISTLHYFIEKEIRQRYAIVNKSWEKDRICDWRRHPL